MRESAGSGYPRRINSGKGRFSSLPVLRARIQFWNRALSPSFGEALQRPACTRIRRGFQGRWFTRFALNHHRRTAQSPFLLHPRPALAPAARQDDVPPSCTFPLCCLRRFDDEIALTGTEIITRVGSDNPLERLTECSVGLVADRPSNVYELLVTLW
jgi:hypothetical protein